MPTDSGPGAGASAQHPTADQQVSSERSRQAEAAVREGAAAAMANQAALGGIRVETGLNVDR